ncbi:MAG: plastocyanin/azurin family copper-binding protein [Halobacteriaceae archaeon]
MVRLDRRRLLRLGGIAALGGLAGCGAPSDTDGAGTTTATTTAATTTATATAAGEEPSGPPGNDVLGGQDALQSSATVEATVLDSDQGYGKFVNTPAVVWVEAGGTVTWNIRGASHSVTAYHPDNDRPLRIPDGADAFDSGVLGAGETYEHTFETPGVYNYFCIPHESLGMVGLVVVDGPQGGPGTNPPTEVSGKAGSALKRLLETAGVAGAGGSQGADYGWIEATWDAYWYSLFNMFNTISLSGNGITFPATEEQKQSFKQRMQGILKNSEVEKPPVVNPKLNMAPFTVGDPHFTQKPDYSGDDGRPDAATLGWQSTSGVVSPASLAWTHLKGVTWAKNFENHFDLLPASQAPRFKAQMLSTIAQIAIKFALVDGKLRKNDENMLLVSGLDPTEGVVDDQPRPRHHAAMLWFLSDMVSLAQGGWFGYENPRPLIPAKNLQKLTDGMGKTVMNAFGSGAFANTRDVGEMLGAIGWYGTHAGSDALAASAADYANALAGRVTGQVQGNGKVGGGAPNQAATQGVVGQGLLWASQLEGVDHAGTAEEVLGYLLDELWDADAGTFATGTGDSTYRITARDAGDITGGLNAADAVLGTDGVKPVFASFFNNTMNRGRLQRAEMPPSRDSGAQYPLPLPPKAGGQYGQAPMYTAAVEYDTGADEWSVADDSFDTEGGMYLSNQDVWVGQWGEQFYEGRGVPGQTDTPK